MRTFILGLIAALFVGAGSQTVLAQRSMRDDSPRFTRSDSADFRRGDDRPRYDDRRGANRRGFCPPGQAKKPGRGSAFNC